MSTDFKWDDQLAQEYAEQYRFSSSRISIEQFKESKQPKPDTEKWQSAQQLVERYEKALKEIQGHIKKAQNESIFVNEMAIALIIAQALTLKTGSDE